MGGGGGPWGCNPPPPQMVRVYSIKCTTDVLCHGDALIYIAKRFPVLVVKF